MPQRKKAAVKKKPITKKKPSMLQYIGTKIINAMPMNRADYNKFRNWELPADENGADEGYLVEYPDGGTRNTKKYKGYVSWSPKKQFEDAYMQTTGMNFGLAIQAAKMGKKIARAGWNGKGMWVIYTPGTPKAQIIGTHYGKFLRRKTVEILPHFDMYTINAQGRRAMLPGWLASQSDMNAQDWMIVK